MGPLYSEIRQQSYEARRGFLHAELDVSLTLTEIARTSATSQAAIRCFAKAQHGLATVLHFYRPDEWGDSERQAIERKTEDLRNRLRALVGPLA